MSAVGEFFALDILFQQYPRRKKKNNKRVHTAASFCWPRCYISRPSEFDLAGSRTWDLSVAPGYPGVPTAPPAPGSLNSKVIECIIYPFSILSILLLLILHPIRHVKPEKTKNPPHLVSPVVEHPPSLFFFSGNLIIGYFAILRTTIICVLDLTTY